MTKAISTQQGLALLGISVAIALWLVPPWWSPLYSDCPVETVTTANGLDISVEGDECENAICAAIFSAENGDTMTFEAELRPGETHTVDVTATYPDGTEVTYSIVCGSGEDSVYDSGQFEVGEA